MSSYQTTNSYNVENLTVTLHFPKSLTAADRKHVITVLKLYIDAEAKSQMHRLKLSKRKA